MTETDGCCRVLALEPYYGGSHKDFHENQLTDPLPKGHWRDYHTAYMNFSSALYKLIP